MQVDGASVEVRRSPGGAPSRHQVEESLRAEGLVPHAWGNGAGAVYDRHRHPHHKVLYCVSGDIVFHTDGGAVALRPGDRMELPAGVDHAATVGSGGVECVEAYRS